MNDTDSTRSVLVTGANTGIGKELARQMAGSGRYAKIILACRNPDKAARAQRELEVETGQRIFDTFHLDVGEVAKVRAAVAGSTFAVDDLVMNAGGTGGATPLTPTVDGVTRIFAENLLGHTVLFDELVRAGRVRRSAVYVGSEATRGAPQLGMARPAFATHSVDELVTMATGAWFRDRKPDGALAYGQVKYIAALWLAAEARRNPAIRLVTMSPGNTGGTDLFRDMPLVPRVLLGRILKPIVLPLFGLAHDLPTGARRLLLALEDESFGGGHFYASAAGKLTGPVVDQSEILPDLANPTFQDHAREAIHRLSAAIR